MSARRMPCKRCHHPRPVGTDGYCASCAEILRRMKLPKSVPPEAGDADANKMDAPGGPQCKCGKPSAFEDGSCVGCAVDGAKRVEEWANKLAGDLVDAGEAERDTLAASAHEGDPITERSSKVPTLPPVGMAGADEGAFSTSAFTQAIDGILQEPIVVIPDPGAEAGLNEIALKIRAAEGAEARPQEVSAAVLDAVSFPPTDTSKLETVTYVAKNGDPDLAVLVSKPASVPPSLMGVTVNVTSLEMGPDETLDGS